MVFHAARCQHGHHNNSGGRNGRLVTCSLNADLQRSASQRGNARRTLEIRAASICQNRHSAHEGLGAETPWLRIAGRRRVGLIGCRWHGKLRVVSEEGSSRESPPKRSLRHYRESEVGDLGVYPWRGSAQNMHSKFVSPRRPLGRRSEITPRMYRDIPLNMYVE